MPRLALFAMLAAVAVGYTGARYARIGDMLGSTSYVVHIQLATSGGIFPGAEVTYRGVPIGRVGEVVPDATGIRVDLKIENGHQVPANALAAVHNRSAVGEQYVDLEPSSDSPPFLHAGDTIPLARTTTPLPAEQLLASLDRFATSVNKNDLSTTISELGTAFVGEGQDLGDILDNTTTFVRGAESHMDATIQLLQNSQTVMRTQVDQSADVRSFTQNLAALTGTLRAHDGQMQTILTGGAELARQLSALATDLQPLLPGLLANLAVLGSIGQTNLAALEEMLVAIPYNVNSTASGARGGMAQFVLQTATDPAVCQRGYIPPSQWRSTQDLSPRTPIYTLGCADPNANPRGTAHIP